MFFKLVISLCSIFSLDGNVIVLLRHDIAHLNVCNYLHQFLKMNLRMSMSNESWYQPLIVSAHANASWILLFHSYFFFVSVEFLEIKP